MIMMRWSEEITLIGIVEPDKRTNAHGFTAEAQETRTTVFANIRPAGTNEFYSAQQAGITVKLKAEVYSMEYEGQTEAEYAGKRYFIIRTYPQENGEITELTLSDQKAGA